MFFCLIVFGVIFAAKKYRQEPSVFSDYIPFSTKNVNMFRDIPCQKDIFEFYYLAKKAGLIGENDRGGNDCCIDFEVGAGMIYSF